ncbi:MAG: hypothetical protein ACLUE1_04955 [Adlercreutzia equolifaciens]
MYDNGYGTDPYAYQPQPQPRPSRASSFLRTVLSVLVLVVPVVLLSWGCAPSSSKPTKSSGSMEETIMPGDMVFREDHLLRQRPGARRHRHLPRPRSGAGRPHPHQARHRCGAARPSICATAASM